MTGPELREWRTRWLYSHVTLARALGVHINTISSWERGVRDIPSYLPLALETLERRKLADLTSAHNGHAQPVADQPAHV